MNLYKLKTRLKNKNSVSDFGTELSKSIKFNLQFPQNDIFELHQDIFHDLLQIRTFLKVLHKFHLCG